MTDEEIKAQALDFAKHNKLRIARERTDPAIFVPSENPISVFMAVSPGAGKTEFSKDLITIFETGNKNKVIRIDADEMRTFMPGYTGSNAHLFQGAVSFVVEKMQDLALHRKQDFVLDGTFAAFEKAKSNIDRSLAKGRRISIFYVYQKPSVAWSFTDAREKLEGRNIPRSAFIDSFLGVRETVKRIQSDYGTKVNISVVKKNFISNKVEEISLIKPNEGSIDHHLGDVYTREDIERIL